MTSRTSQRFHLFASNLKVEDLYNKDADLPRNRQSELVDLLEQASKKYTEESRDTIPQRIFYRNFATGIARTDSQLKLRLGDDEDVVLTVLKGAVKEKEIISCSYLEGFDKNTAVIARDSDTNIVKYSLPLQLGPPKLEFMKTISLVIKHFADIYEQYKEDDIKPYVRDEKNPSQWNEIEVDCDLHSEFAIVYLNHFSTFVLAAEKGLTAELPRLRTRVLIGTTKQDPYYFSPQRTVICIVFDTEYTIKNAQSYVKCRYGVDLDTSRTDTLLLKPLSKGVIAVRDAKSSDADQDKQIRDIAVEDLENLTSAPIICCIEPDGTQQERFNAESSSGSKIVVTQEELCQEFEISYAPRSADIATGYCNIQTPQKGRGDGLHYADEAVKFEGRKPNRSPDMPDDDVTNQKIDGIDWNVFDNIVQMLTDVHEDIKEIKEKNVTGVFRKRQRSGLAKDMIFNSKKSAKFPQKKEHYGRLPKYTDHDLNYLDLCLQGDI